MLNLPIVYPKPVISTDPPPINPTDLGLPDKFSSWRPAQWDAVQRIIDTRKRFIAICAPTGFGKSLAYMAASLMSGRTVILTATLGLQDQIASDVIELGRDIRGLSNYYCPIADDFGIPRDTKVSEAPCQCGYNCERKRIGGCQYYDDYRQAQRAELVVTNYQCWLWDGVAGESASSSKAGDKRGDLQYGPFLSPSTVDYDIRLAQQDTKMLVADEIHSAPDQLSMFLGIDMSRRECLAIRMEWPDAGLNVDDWCGWAKTWLLRIERKLLDAEAGMKDYAARSARPAWSKEFKHLRDMKRKLERLAGMQSRDGWIMNELDVEGKSTTGVRFDTVNPARYAEESLWRGIKKVVLVSATARPKTAALLGIGAGEMEFIEYDSSFNIKRRPTIYYSTGVRMSYKTEKDDRAMRLWLNQLDDIIEPQIENGGGGGKGIVHCVSYNRAKFIYANSRYKSHMVIHDSRDRMKKIEDFRAYAAPAILLSPSVDTGYDFKDDEARWQVIAKLPFASVSDKIVKARQDADKDYGLYIAAQTLVQMAGRIVRSETDYGVTIIMDDNFEWFYWKVRNFIPQWFKEAVVFWDKRKMGRVPARMLREDFEDVTA